MRKILLGTLVLLSASNVTGQHLFPKKLNNCDVKRFCLDCGDEKAAVDSARLSQVLEKIAASAKLEKINGRIKMQILVDSLGNGCVLSHTDMEDGKLTKKIVAALNKFDGFIAARSKNIAEPMTSFNMVFEVRNEQLSGRVERVDMNAFKKSFDRPRNPEIYNKKYDYKNESLGSYDIKTWNASNSSLPNNSNDHISIDKNGIIWLSVDEAFVKFDGKDFKNIGQEIKPAEGYFNFFSVATDNRNVKWLHTSKHIYSYNDNTWTKYDSAAIGIDGAYRIINNPATDEVFFCAEEGLVVYKNGQWDKLYSSGLPSTRVAFAKRDSKNRIWIGTYKGSVMIDENNKITKFNDTENVLNGKCITSMDEDENGNLYFGLYEYDRKIKTQVNNDEGIAIRSTDGVIRQYTTANSGMPFNHVTDVLYDKNEKVLWIATDRAGLVRYDLSGKWENYHSGNSSIPTSYIAALAMDNKGILYLATRQGLVKIEKRRP